MKDGKWERQDGHIQYTLWLLLMKERVCLSPLQVNFIATYWVTYRKTNLIKNSKRVNTSKTKGAAWGSINSLRQSGRTEKFADSKPQLTTGPVLVIGGFLPELFSQMIQPLQPTDLGEEPLLEAFLCLLQALPRTGYVLGKNINSSNQQVVAALSRSHR